MRTVLLLIGAFISVLFVHAQDSSKENISEYRATATKLHDLIHTKLEIKLDYDKAWLIGKAWITLKPHFYSTDSLLLDAQGMDIHQIAMFRNGSLKPLKFVYDGMVLKIFLDRFYTSKQPYTVYIDYTAKPNDLKAAGSAAATARTTARQMARQSNQAFIRRRQVVHDMLGRFGEWFPLGRW